MKPSLESGTEGEPQGADPRYLPVKIFKSLGHVPKPLSKVIRAHCVECSGGSKAEARLCTATKCHLWPYRMGTNPFRQKQTPSEKQLAVLRKGREAE